MTNIHPTAIVAPKAELGQNVTIGPFTIIEANTIIDDNTTIASHVLVASGARIGKNCKIHKGTVVGTPAQDLKFAGEATTLEIGDRTEIREFCTLNRGTKDRLKSVIGSDCFLLAYCHVAHDCRLGNHIILANGVQLGGHVTIEDWVIIGGLSGVHQFCHIGQHTIVGGHFRVTQDVPPYITAAGEPLGYAGINSIGLRRRGFNQSQLSAIKNTYRLLYRSKLNRSQAIARIKAELEPTPEVVNILNFIENSKRGLI